jgi:hypothetical protein
MDKDAFGDWAACAAADDPSGCATPEEPANK